MNHKLFLTCPKFITPYLSEELKDLGFERQEQHVSGIMVEGTMVDAMRLNLLLRCAHRVLVHLSEFKAQNADDLYRNALKFNWEDFIPCDGYFSVVSSVDNDNISNSQFAHQKLKDAIVDRLRQRFGRRPDSGPRTDQAVVYLYWKQDQCIIYLDTSGVPISKRGYRVMTHIAPLNELLAAAIVKASLWTVGTPFINPMCGAGTLAIEAALVASNTPSQFLRTQFGFMFLVGYEQREWDDIRTSNMGRKKAQPDGCIIATDSHSGAIMATRKNATQAGVLSLVDVRMCDFRKTEVPPGDGVVILNPEYGERMGTESELERLYTSIGDWFKEKCEGKRGFIFTGNMKLAKTVGLKTSRKIPFYNADIECRLLEYELYKGTKKIKAESLEPKRELD